MKLIVAHVERRILKTCVTGTSNPWQRITLLPPANPRLFLALFFFGPGSRFSTSEMSASFLYLLSYRDHRLGSSSETGERKDKDPGDSKAIPSSEDEHLPLNSQGSSAKNPSRSF